MKIKCLIVDDEKLAIKVLKTYIDKVPFLELEASTTSPFEAMDILKKSAVDLVFLDIEMPDLTGLELVQSLEHKPAFIFVTAYREYAADAFDLDSVDYLVKPVSFPRFLKAVNKYRSLYESPAQDKFHEIRLRADRKTYKVAVQSILYIEGLKDYVKVFLNSGDMLIVKETMKLMEEKLQPYRFVRCHKSFIISIPHVKAFSAEQVEIGDRQLPVGRNFREAVVRELSG